MTNSTRNPHKGTEAVIRRDAEPPVLGYPATGLDAGRAAALGPFLTSATSAEQGLRTLLAAGDVTLLLSAHDVPDDLPSTVRSSVLERGERRELLVGSVTGGLAQLTEGTRIQAPGRRRRALLAAYHPGLVAVESGPAAARIVPLWTDPSLEPRGELLEAESWFPGAGEGIPVLLAPESAPVWDESLTREDPGAAAVVLGERAIARAFPQAVCCVRGVVFGGGIRFKVILLSEDGRRAVRGDFQGSADALAELVDTAVSELTRRGALTLD